MRVLIVLFTLLLLSQFVVNCFSQSPSPPKLEIQKAITSPGGPLFVISFDHDGLDDDLEEEESVFFAIYRKEVGKELNLHVYSTQAYSSFPRKIEIPMTKFFTPTDDKRSYGLTVVAIDKVGNPSIPSDPPVIVLWDGVRPSTPTSVSVTVKFTTVSPP